MRSERPHATTYATDPRSKVLLVEASSGDAHVLSSYRAFDATSAASARERGRGSGPKSREVGRAATSCYESVLTFDVHSSLDQEGGIHFRSTCPQGGRTQGQPQSTLRI